MKKGDPTVHLDLSGLQVYHMKQVTIPSNTTKLLLAHNLLRSFDGLPPLRFLGQLDLDHTKICSFKGAPKLRALRWLSMRNTPISKSSYFELMVAIVFQKPLVLNNAKLPPPLLKKAQKYMHLRPALVDEGKVITALHPLKLYDPITKQYSDGTVPASIASPAPQEAASEQGPSVAVLCNRIIESNGATMLTEAQIDGIRSKLESLRGRFPNRDAPTPIFAENPTDDELNTSTPRAPPTGPEP